MTRIEALADALMRMHGYHDPFSVSYQNRNPGMLKAFNAKHTKDENGYRIFNSFSSGYDNLVIDVRIKCGGTSHCRLKSTDTLRDLVVAYGHNACAARSVKNFLRHALKDDNIFESQELAWFLEDQKAGN